MPIKVPALASRPSETRALELAPLPVTTAPAPVAEPVPAPAESNEGWQAGSYHGHQVDMGGGMGSYGSHGPAIMLRGGMGGIDDKCDLRPRTGRSGIAINRTAPTFGGYPPGIR